ncbi:hypothetical protein M404DRAFT_30563 [Pisolithus tinctorius Marx 270]|uniref:Uncharacterized protein n=1 Tax=Pisolithus tinctorius Marx 270 TaxID=870435 RepID=A0A0C3IR09_PISTI|nr:hypothetical protein M404DRAFT_30563 [Pisolithus tinctorius Marx 270]
MLPEDPFIANSSPAAPISALFDVAGNPSPGDNCIKSTSAEPLTPHAPAIGNSETKPESQEGTPRLLEKVASELPVSTVSACGPHCPLKRSFTPDSFAESEDIGSISTQFLHDRWAQIRENLIARQEHYKLIFTDTSTPPHQMLSQVVPSSFPVEQEMLDHGTLTGKDLDILTFGSDLPNLGPNFHSPEALLLAINYFQEYNMWTSTTSQPLTSFATYHLPSDPEQCTLECQLRQIRDQVLDEQNSIYDNGQLEVPHDVSFTWSYPDEDDESQTDPTDEALPHLMCDKDDPDPFFIDKEV